jgi:hypothetical protein
VEVPVEHADRQIECHDLMEFCRNTFRIPQNKGDWSCETMAETLALDIIDRYKLAWTKVEVLEDGECGASYEYVQN